MLDLWAYNIQDLLTVGISGFQKLCGQVVVIEKNIKGHTDHDH